MVIKYNPEKFCRHSETYILYICAMYHLHFRAFSCSCMQVVAVMSDLQQQNLKGKLWWPQRTKQIQERKWMWRKAHCKSRTNINTSSSNIIDTFACPSAASASDTIRPIILFQYPSAIHKYPSSPCHWFMSFCLSLSLLVNRAFVHLVSFCWKPSCLVRYFSTSQ